MNKDTLSKSTFLDLAYFYNERLMKKVAFAQAPDF